LTRILYVATRHGGGSMVSLTCLLKTLDQERYAPYLLMYQGEGTQYVQELRQEGLPVAFLDPRPPGKREVQHAGTRDIAAWLRAHGGGLLADLYTDIKSLYRFVLDDLPRAWRILRVIRAVRPQLVHLNNGLRNSRAAVIATRLAGVPCVCHMRTFRELELPDRFLTRWVHHFVHISSAVEAYYAKLGIPPDRSTVIHNGVELPLYAGNNAQDALRQELAIGADDVVVGNVGRLDWWKGHEFFLEAMAQVEQHVPRLKCLIVGGSDDEPRNAAYRRKLASLTESLGLAGRTIFTGHRKDVPCIMSLLDVLVHSASEPEPFGRVIIEGMAAGKPVVATAAGGVPDIIEDGVSGMLVPPGDAASIARAVRYLLDHPSEAQAMGIAARQRVSSRFTIQHHAGRIQELYGALLRPPRSSKIGWAAPRS
jgi:glycosyltransferase involved in cell wall biosynthesis